MNPKNINHQFVFVLMLTSLFLGSCATPPPRKPMTISEQIVVDMKKAEDLMKEFQRRVVRAPVSDIQIYLNKLAQFLAKQEGGFESRSVEVKVLQDSNILHKRFFAFPGTTIFIPMSFLVKVEFENELAAAISYELAQVIHRHLARRLDQQTQGPDAKTTVLFGASSVFDFDRDERKASIIKATAILRSGKFDTRGLASLFQRYPSYVSGVWNEDSDLDKKEVEFNLREAQRAKSEFLPLRDPVVRSGDFIEMKNLLNNQIKNRIKK